MIARMQAQAGNQPGQQPPGGNPGKPKAAAVSMAVNERNNSILVQARHDKMAVIAQVVEAVDIPVNRDDSLLVNLNRMQVYRLSGIDPEPVVKTLMEIGNLEPATRLEVDKKNSAIIAYASLADHVTIRAVVDKLTGSERKFEVIRLRRLAADYVAGTIDFMMGSGAKKEKSRSNPFFGGYESPRREGAENSKEFRVDADVEHNRLLLWANPVEVTAGGGPAGQAGRDSRRRKRIGRRPRDRRRRRRGNAGAHRTDSPRLAFDRTQCTVGARGGSSAGGRPTARRSAARPPQGFVHDVATAKARAGAVAAAGRRAGGVGVVSSGRDAERGRQPAEGTTGGRTAAGECPPRAAAGEDHPRTGRQADPLLGRRPGPGPAGGAGDPIGACPQGLPCLPSEICLGGRRLAEPGGLLQGGQERTSPHALGRTISATPVPRTTRRTSGGSRSGES